MKPLCCVKAGWLLGAAQAPCPVRGKRYNIAWHMSMRDPFGDRRSAPIQETQKENGVTPQAHAQGLVRFIDVIEEDKLMKRAALEAVEVKKRAALETAYEEILTKNQDLVDKFLEIAERKVSILDDYGDENWDALPEEVHKCLSKVAKRQQSIDLSAISTTARLGTNSKNPLGAYSDLDTRFLALSLESKFRAYHEARKKLSSAEQDISALSGVGFETYLAKLLREAGFESVAGTPASGDQGADLIARRNGRTIAIQAKGYRGSVGNGAVQEIVGALRFYRADEGWVVTNSTFTASARALAQANNIRLIDGNDLKDIVALKARL